MATPNFNLPTYQSGDVAKFLTAEGWNGAMIAIDRAIEGGGEAGIVKNQAFTYVAEFAENEATCTLVIPVAVDAIKSVQVFMADGSAVSAITAEKNTTTDTSTDVSVTLETAPSAKLAANVTVVKGV